MAYHINKISGLSWIEFSGSAWNEALKSIKSKINVICSLMRRHKDKLARNATLKLLGPRKSKKKDTVMVLFKNSLKTVKLAAG